MSDSYSHDEKWMQRAIKLARLSRGYTRPNPPVGAVVVKDGRVIGEGRHKRAGCDHAEVVALKACIENVEGATLYVTLEPCSTHGRTPPCTDLIIRSKIKRVVIGCKDYYEHHCGKGHKILEQSGVEVISGVCEQECYDLAVPFFRHVHTGKPYLSLKLGMTLDGCIADHNSCSQWITGEESRLEVQRIRSTVDAVMVGSGTVCVDDPSLLCRLDGGDNLMRIVIDSSGTIPATAQVLTDSAAGRTVVFTSENTPLEMLHAWRKNGAEVKILPLLKCGHLSLEAVMSKLGDMDLMHVVCEGGGGLAGALHDADLIDEYLLFYAPAVLGDINAKRGFAFNNMESTLSGMPRMQIKDVRMFGSDVQVRMVKSEDQTCSQD